MNFITAQKNLFPPINYNFVYTNIDQLKYMSAYVHLKNTNFIEWFKNNTNIIDNDIIMDLTPKGRAEARKLYGLCRPADTVIYQTRN